MPMAVQVRLNFDKGDRGFTALAFSPDGKRLVAVATDNGHTVYVYDWRKQRQLFSMRGQLGEPPQVAAAPCTPLVSALKFRRQP